MLLTAVFALLAGADVSAVNAAETAAGDQDKMICKRFLETGSLVKGYRECKTRWEWQRERENRRMMSVSDACGVRGDTPGGC